MGSGCCKKTKIADVSLTVMQTQNVDATEIPYGCVIIYPGILKPNQTYTCPILSIHTYHESSNKISVDYAAGQVSNKKQFDQQLGHVTTLKEEQLCSDETTIMIPVEDIMYIYYTCDVKKNIKAQEHSVPIVSEKGCCGCCCGTEPQPVRQHHLLEEKAVQRVITIHIQYSKYSNLSTISNARILPAEDRAQFYKSHFQPLRELKFYLTRNREYGSDNFNQKKEQAENLCRIITQLKGMNDDVSAATTAYPSSHELQQILQQSYFGIFGDLHQERLHSVQTQQDFGTHVPEPTIATIIATAAMRTTDATLIQDD